MVSMLLAAAMTLPGQVKLADDVDEAVRTYTVRIINKTNGGVGNGVLFRRSPPQAFVLTSAHIANKGDDISIEIFPAKGEPIKINRVEVALRSDPQEQDLAVLIFTADNDTVPDWIKLIAPNQAPQASPKKSLTAYSAAATPMNPPTTRQETVLDIVELKKPGAAKAARFWKAKAPPEPGRSGGPLFDEKGRLLGICSGGVVGKESYYTHIDEIEAFLQSPVIRLRPEG